MLGEDRGGPVLPKSPSPACSVLPPLPPPSSTMAITPCLAALSCLWDPIQVVLLQFPSFLRRRRVEEATSPPILDLSGINSVGQVLVSSTDDMVAMDNIRLYLKEIADSLMDDRVGVIGIIGMGGIGKTTLLQKINNSFLGEIGSPRLFEVVIWVTVSQDPNHLNIQRSIGNRIGLNLSADGASQTRQDRAVAIFTTLLNKRFLLLLDDVREAIQLKDVGIPAPTFKNGSKIILTSRSMEVCRRMNTDKLVRMDVLNEFQSWELFKRSFGATVDLENPNINDLAKDVVANCGGHPLALVTVGRAMANAASVRQWVEAQAMEPQDELGGVTGNMLRALRFSIDGLGDETLKQCLLFCSIYPSGENIDVEEIIEHWIGEGFRDNASIPEAEKRGYGVIDELKKRSLLQRGSSSDYVMMHPIIRDMCLWIMGGDIDKNNHNSVLTDEGLKYQLFSSETERYLMRCKMGRLKRVCLMQNKIDHMARLAPSVKEGDPSPSYPNLQTLICKSPPSSIENGFFRFMPFLRVLNLSRVQLIGLPEDVGLLTELRYINLTHTGIRSLPKGFGKLRKLIMLNLNETPKLRRIPPEVIPAIVGLRLLRAWNSTAFDLLSQFESWGNELERQELTVTRLHSLEMLLRPERLCCCCTALDIRGLDNIGILKLPLVFSELQGLRRLRLHDFWEEGGGVITLDGRSLSPSLEELEVSDVSKIEIISPSSFKCLKRLTITHCHGIRELSWLRQVPCIKIIHLSACYGIKDLLPSIIGEQGEALLHVTHLSLRDLPALKSISSRYMLFSSLEHLTVLDCPQLKNLPFASHSAPNIKEIHGQIELWRSLVGSRFLPCFQVHSD